MKIVTAEWTDVPAADRLATSGSTASLDATSPPSAAIGEAIERRAWWTTKKRSAQHTAVRWCGGTSEADNLTLASEHLVSTNGWACAETMAEAEDRAAAELIERHLYSLHYEQRLEGVRRTVDPNTSWQRLLSRFNLELRLYTLPTGLDDQFSVCLACIFDSTPGGPASTVGLGNGPTPTGAAEHAVLEALKVRMWAYQRQAATQLGREELNTDPSAARLRHFGTPEGAAGLRSYLDVREAARPPQALTRDAPTMKVNLRPILVEIARQAGIELFRVDRRTVAAPDLRPVAWMHGRGARFINTDRTVSGEIPVPLV